MGKMKIIPVEGNRQKLDGGAMFGNVPKEMWKKWIVPDDKNRIQLACRSMLMQKDSGENILFDAGVGNFFEPKLQERFGIEDGENRLIVNLEKLGLNASDITAVVLSHLHFDHCGGILSGHGEEPHLLFPNAKIYVGKEHWERARAPLKRERASFIPELHVLLEASGRLELIDSETHPDFGPDVTFRFFHGHTVGLMVSEVQTEEGPVTFTSDLIPGMPWIHLPVAMGYDRFAEGTVQEKEVFLADALERGVRLFFPHDPETAMAAVLKDEKGRFRGNSLVTVN